MIVKYPIEYMCHHRKIDLSRINMNFKKIFISILITVVSCGAFAESQWRYLGSYAGYQAAIDKNSIRPVSEYNSQNRHKAWVQQVVTEDLIQDGLAVGDSKMVLYWVSCEARTYGTKSITVYKKSKAPQTDTASFVEMQDVIPGTLAEDFLNFICDNQ